MFYHNSPMERAVYDLGTFILVIAWGCFIIVNIVELYDMYCFLRVWVPMDIVLAIITFLHFYFRPPKGIDVSDMVIDKKYLRFDESYKYYQRYERVFDPDPYNDILQMEPKDYTESYVVPNTDAVCPATNLDYEKALYKKFARHNTNIEDICKQVKEQMQKQGFQSIIKDFEISFRPISHFYGDTTGYTVFFSDPKDGSREEHLIAERKKFFKQVLYNIDMNDAEAFDIASKMISIREANGVLSEHQMNKTVGKRRHKLYDFTRFEDKKKWLDLCLKCEIEEASPYFVFHYLSKIYKRIENIENDRLKYLKFVYENLPTTKEAYTYELEVLQTQWNKLYCPTKKIVNSKTLGTYCMTLLASNNVFIITQSGQVCVVNKADVTEATKYGDRWA